MMNWLHDHLMLIPAYHVKITWFGGHPVRGQSLSSMGESFFFPLYQARKYVQGQTGRVLYWESGFSFVFLICMATYVSPYVAIVPCVCVRLFMCHARLRCFFFNILFSNSIFYVNTFYVSDFWLIISLQMRELCLARCQIQSKEWELK